MDTTVSNDGTFLKALKSKMIYKYRLMFFKNIQIKF